eukprot:350724-Chlamydomonas_euryale.AAC.3
MPRDLTACGRHPPVPRHAPLAFYSAVRLGDPEMVRGCALCNGVEAVPQNNPRGGGTQAHIHRHTRIGSAPCDPGRGQHAKPKSEFKVDLAVPGVHRLIHTLRVPAARAQAYGSNTG